MVFSAGVLDPKLVAGQMDLVRERLERRGREAFAPLREGFQALDQERRGVLREVEDLRHQQKTQGEEIARLGRAKEDASALKAEMKVVSERVKALDGRLQEIEKQLEETLLQIPNLPDESVPAGDESHNKEIRRSEQAPPKFAFKPLDHIELGTRLGILDFERAARISGARFAVLWGVGAQLERALARFMIDVHTKPNPERKTQPYLEVIPPYLVTAETLTGTGNLPKFESDLFKTRAGDRDLYLIPTAEVPVTNLHRDEILEASELPKKYVAFTPCFRSEAGSYGKDVRGLIRQHQFHKVELVKLATPERSMDELEAMVADAEEVLKRLGLAYRVVLLAAGDMGFSAAKTYDIEVWLPGQDTYREISSCSNCTDFQARRASLRYRPQPGAKPRFVHTLNGSGLAVGRTLIAVLENYQQADGSVLIPEALRPYLDGLERIALPH
jgi:seryl-tRNA synthetase